MGRWLKKIHNSLPLIPEPLQRRQLFRLEFICVLVRFRQVAFRLRLLLLLLRLLVSLLLRGLQLGALSSLLEELLDELHGHLPLERVHHEQSHHGGHGVDAIEQAQHGQHHRGEAGDDEDDVSEELDCGKGIELIKNNPLKDSIKLTLSKFLVAEDLDQLEGVGEEFAEVVQRHQDQGNAMEAGKITR